MRKVTYVITDKALAEVVETSSFEVAMAIMEERGLSKMDMEIRLDKVEKPTSIPKKRKAILESLGIVK